MADEKPDVVAGERRAPEMIRELAEYIAVSLHQPEKQRHVELILQGWHHPVLASSPPESSPVTKVAEEDQGSLGSTASGIQHGSTPRRRDE